MSTLSNTYSLEDGRIPRCDLCHWASTFRRFGRPSCLHIENAVQVLNCCRELPTQRHNPTTQKTGIFEHHRYENLKFQTITNTVHVKFLICWKLESFASSPCLYLLTCIRYVQWYVGIMICLYNRSHIPGSFALKPKAKEYICIVAMLLY